MGTKLAAEKSISKGVVISALRLLHATGVVKTESVGGKGTKVTVLNRSSKNRKCRRKRNEGNST